MIAKCIIITLRRKQRRLLLLLRFLLVSVLVVKRTSAHDPVYKLVSSRTTRPWSNSKYNNNNPAQRQRSSEYLQRQRQRQQNDYTDKFMDFDQARKDKNARLYNIDFKRRRPNELSITTRLVYLTCACFGMQVFKPAVTAAGMKLSERILRGEQLYRLFTPIFLHGGIFHLFTNMASLQRVGNDVERLFGPGRYLATYVVAGVAGNVVSALQSPNPSLGASGAVFGIVGAYFVFLNRNDWMLGSYGRAMTDSITQTMGANIFLGLIMPQIDQWAHVGGLVAGGAMAYLFGPKLYLCDLPTGPGRVVIDRPILRAPEYLERIPQQLDQVWQRATKQVNRILPSIGTNGSPWRLPTGDNFRRRRQTPSRSIKPGKVD